MAERRPRLRNPRLYTLREALDAVGRRLFGRIWNSECIDAPQRPPLDILDSAPLDPSSDLDRPVRWRPVETREGDGEDASTDHHEFSDQMRAAWAQREDAQHYLSEIIRDGDVSVWLDCHGGGRRRIEPEEWEARDGPLKLNYMSSLGEIRGGEWGQVFINEAELNARLPDVPQIRAHTNSERSEQTKKRNAELQRLADEISNADSFLKKDQVVKIICDKYQPGSHRDQEERLAPESVKRIVRLPKGKRRARRAR